MELDRKAHWEKVYETKNPDEVSWTQEIPKVSLEFIRSFGLPKSAKIIDIGGGDSKLVDYLLDDGYENITVLDISEKSLQKAQKRLGERAKKINWIASDIIAFKPKATFDIWHDRAAFHFLVTPEQIEKYIEIARNAVTGFLTIGTFSENGPLKCSGLEITQYSETSMAARFEKYFEKISCKMVDHITPFGTNQNFVFCSFRKLAEE